MKEVKTEKKEVEINEYYCDICNEKIWGLDRIEYDDEDNYNYGDCGYQKQYIYDICEKCMKNIIFSYIKKKTKKEPRIEEREW